MDLSTKYLGLQLRTPLVPSASPLSEEIDSIKQMEDAGAAAVVLYSLFEEQLQQDRAELDHHLEHGTYSFPEALTYFPEPEEFRLGPEEDPATFPRPSPPSKSPSSPASTAPLSAAGPTTPKAFSRPAPMPSS